MKRYLGFLCILLLISCCFNVFSSSVKANEIADRVQSFYDNVTSFEANFEQILKHKESGSTEKRKGKIHFKKPLQIRWETMAPHKEQWIVSEKDVWDFLPDEEIAYRYSSDILKNSGGVIGVLTGQKPLKRDFIVQMVGDDGSLRVLQLLPKEPSVQLVEALVWVEQSGVINKMASTDFYGNVNEIRLNNFKANVALQNKIFDFQAPKGIEVEDLRKSDLKKNIFQ